MGASSSKSFSVNKAMSTPAPIENARCYSSDMDDRDYIEQVVCKVDDLKDNEMKTFELGDAGSVLVVKQKGEFSALGTKCSHFGAPLVAGALGDGRIRCQWHGACFNIKTGDIEDFPGFESLPCYQVTVEKDGGVRVRAKKSLLKANKQFKNTVPVPQSLQDKSTVVIVGGGPSGATCAETLRQEGYNGRLVMVAKENYLPYDRIMLSKRGFANDPAQLQFRSQEFYDESKIEVLKGNAAVSVDTENKKVKLSNSESINYTALYLATGATPRQLDIPGKDLKNIFTLRDIQDAAGIAGALGSDKNKELVVLGLSFVGLEAAATGLNMAKKVTAVGPTSLPLENIFGKEIGEGLLNLYRGKGVNFIFENTIVSCEGENGILKSVTLKDGFILPADVLVIGIGSTFNTEFLKDSGVNLHPDGSIPVNNRLQTNVPDVFAGGDIAYAPVFAVDDKPAAIGHIGLSQYHGRIAALNILKKDVPLKTVPYFWTFIFGESIRYTGHGKYSNLVIDGDPSSLEFVIYYLDKNDRVISVASSKRDPVVSQFAEFTAQGNVLYKKDLNKDIYGWLKVTRAVAAC